jgi:EAL and modified HD-GYP domain-containing signal transduction protein
MSKNMEGYVARQAIYDRTLAVAAYELLYRGSPGATSAAGISESASEEVLDSAFFSVGWKVLVGNKPALWNVPQNLLMSSKILLIPPERVYLEILETTAATSEVVARCRELRALGYKLVLDDYVGEAEKRPILDLCHWVKVDWMASSPEAKQRIPKYGGRKFLAEKVETREEFDEALRLGYDYFQGYFLERPQLMSGRKLPAAQMERLRLLSELSKTEPDTAVVESAVSRDLDLTFKLMTWVNSAASGRRAPVASVRDALIWMGIEKVRRFVGMLALAGMGGGAKSELLHLALIRARMSDLMAQATGHADEHSKAFLGGLLSMLEALLEKPMVEICEEMALPEDIRQMFEPGECHEAGFAKRCLNVAIAWQRGEKDAAEQCASTGFLTGSDLGRIYLESVRWVQEGLDG